MDKREHPSSFFLIRQHRFQALGSMLVTNYIRFPPAGNSINANLPQKHMALPAIRADRS